MEYLKSGGLSLMDKLNILTDSAKYDVACTSSGSERKGSGRGMGNTIAGGFVTVLQETEGVFRF